MAVALVIIVGHYPLGIMFEFPDADTQKALTMPPLVHTPTPNLVQNICLGIVDQWHVSDAGRRYRTKGEPVRVVDSAAVHVFR
jgi:hypothetical protein